MSTVIDGKLVAAEMRGGIAEAAKELFQRKGVRPGLGVLLVGDDPASQSYVVAKEKACHEVGFFSDNQKLPATISQTELNARIEAMNVDPRIHGILVQLPLPRHLDAEAVLNVISPDKDVDGFTPLNVGRMMTGQRAFVPCTPNGVIELLLRANVKTDGAHVVIVGRSNIVGRPLAYLLSRKSPGGNATVTMCHTGTRDLKRHTLQADILVAAAGMPDTILPGMVKENAVVIDVGVNRVADASRASGFRLVGDVNAAALDVAKMHTPVPGGVGPMTIAMLLQNTLQSAKQFAGE